MKIYVSRQRYWPDGDLLVELALGGLDYSNPGMMGAKYRNLGEGQEYTDPREAVEAGLAILKAWRLDAPEEDIQIGHGNTFGFTMPFSGESEDKLKSWADKIYDSLPKCAQCSDLLGKEKYGCHETGEYECCSERCAEKYYYQELDDEQS